jgi:tRNA(Ile2) C34 agmatinyltransferase TiaS
MNYLVKMIGIVGETFSCPYCGGVAEEEEEGWYRCWSCGRTFKVIR